MQKLIKLQASEAPILAGESADHACATPRQSISNAARSTIHATIVSAMMAVVHESFKRFDMGEILARDSGFPAFSCCNARLIEHRCGGLTYFFSKTEFAATA